MDLQNKAAVIGGLNADIWGRPSGPIILRDSNPGSVTLTPGGVGRNIAHDLCLLGLDVSLVSAVGDESADPFGKNGSFSASRGGGNDDVFPFFIYRFYLFRSPIFSHRFHSPPLFSSVQGYPWVFPRV